MKKLLPFALITLLFGGVYTTLSATTPEDKVTASPVEHVHVTDTLNIPLLKKYCVVTGAFGSMVNAVRQQEMLKKGGLPAFVICNEAGLFRTVAFSSDDRKKTIAQCDSVRARFVPDAWVLEVK